MPIRLRHLSRQLRPFVLIMAQAMLQPILQAQIHNFPWPISPMNAQHRISATFDECREDRDHFHNGTDIPLAPDGEALSIMAGQVLGIGSDWIRVEDFAYVHVNPNPALQVGNAVNQGAVLGWTDSYAHIHLNYGGGGSGHPTGNPLLPGGLVPFDDPYHPRSPIIELVLDATNTPFPSNSISGHVDIVAQAADTTDLESSIDMNNGIYTIGWALYSADTSQVLEGPYFWFEADELYSNDYIMNVYAPGSSTSIYKYRVTNKITSNGYLDCDLYEPGPYVVCVMSSDSRENWDTSYVAVNISDSDQLPPGQPILNYVGSDENGDLYLEWTPPNDSDLAGYILEFSYTGESWSSSHGPSEITAEMTNFTVTGLADDTYIKFRLSAVDNAPIPNQSQTSDTYGVQLGSGNSSILIVDGFDRTNGSWTQTQHDFACYYSDAIVASGFEGNIATASNEWITANQSLSQYQSIFWFVGDDSRTDETFSSSEQSVISNYLNNGGSFFASGAEIGYDLSAGNTADQNFMHEVLHLNYIGDNAGNTHVNGIGDIFSGISFNYGTAPYVEDWPDYFGPADGGEIVLQYGNSRNAAISYRDQTRATFVMGFALETIDTDLSRSNLMERILQYFSINTSIANIENPLTFGISGIYPNPFNASVNIQYTLNISGEIAVIVYDITGREVYSRRIGFQTPGAYSVHWQGVANDGRNLASGTYLLNIVRDGQSAMAKKLLLLK